MSARDVYATPVAKHLPGQHDQQSHNPWGERPRKVHVHREALPPQLYHATTNLPAVLESGILRPSGGMAGGLGAPTSGQEQVVSLTRSAEIAQDLAHDLRRIAWLARGDLDPEAYAQFAHEDELRAGLAPGALEKAVKEARFNYDFNREASPQIYNTSDKLKALASEVYRTSYLNMRESLGGKKNPIFFLPWERARGLDPAKIGVVRVETAALPEEAVLYEGPDYFLEEVRSEGPLELPVAGVHKHLPGQHDQQRHAGYGIRISKFSTPLQLPQEAISSLKRLSVSSLEGGMKAVLNYPVENLEYQVAIAYNEQGEPVGWAIASENDTSVYVEKRYRRRGIGRALLNQLGKESPSIGWTTFLNKSFMTEDYEPLSRELFLEIELKHLRGRHDQRRHAGGRAAAEQPAGGALREELRTGRAYVSAGSSYRITELRGALEALGFRGVWVNPTLSEGEAVESLVEIHDLVAEVRRLLPKFDLARLGLKLGVNALYSGANATYFSDQKLIEIHKERGESFIHELAHALDDAAGGGGGQYASRQDTGPGVLFQAIANMALYSPEGYRWAAQEKPGEPAYWTSPVEVFARMFDQYVWTHSAKHRERRGPADSEQARLKFNWLPEGQFYKHITPLFEELFRELELKHRLTKSAVGAGDRYLTPV